MSLAGTGVVAIWHDLLPEAKDDFYEWHNREHMPERVGIPGFAAVAATSRSAARRNSSTCTKPTARKCSAGQDYLDRLNAPTEWTRRVVPSFRNVARSICRVVFTSGVGSGGVMLTMRFDVDAAASRRRVEALTTHILPPLALSQRHLRRAPVPADEASATSRPRRRRRVRTRRSCRRGSC